MDSDRAVFNVRDILVARVAPGRQAAEVGAIAAGRTGLYSVTGLGPVGMLADHVKTDGWVRTGNQKYVSLAGRSRHRHAGWKRGTAAAS